MKAQVDLVKCTGHAICVGVCPVDAITMEDNKAVVSDACIECGACVASCPEVAITL